MEIMKSYRELTRRGRLFRFRELAEMSLAAYGMNGARLKFIQYGENIIYQVDVPSSTTLTANNSIYIPNRYVLRIHAMGDAEAIVSELTWLTAMSQKARLPVPAPVSTPDGKLVVKIVTPSIPRGRIVSLLRWLDGRSFAKGLRPKHLTALGKVVANLHAFSATWTPPSEFTRPSWDWDAQIGGSSFEYPLEELVASMPLDFQEPFLTISQEAKRVMESFGKGSDTYGLIHSDLYPENVLFKAGKAYPIDFEDCGFGYWMWDIAVALCQWAGQDNWEQMRDAFRDGYAQIRILPEVQWAHLDLFVATQFATMVLWASAFLKYDPIRVAEYEPWRDNNGNKLIRYLERGCIHNLG